MMSRPRGARAPSCSLSARCPTMLVPTALRTLAVVAFAALAVAGPVGADRLPAQVHINLSSTVVDLDAGEDAVEVRVVVDDALLQDVRRALLVWRPESAGQSRVETLDFPVNTLDASYRLTFPPGAAPGRWRLLYLRLEAADGTSRELYPGTLLEVRNTNPDRSRPVVTGVDLSPAAVDVSTGDRSVTVTMFANDDRDLQKGWVYLHHGGTGQRKTVELAGPALTGVATFEAGAAGDAGGTWAVDGVALFDGATNRVFESTGVDDGNLVVKVTNPAADTTRPTFGSISLSSSVVDVTGGRATLDVFVSASDADSGVATIEGRMQSDESGQRRTFGIDPATGSTTVVFDAQDSSGVWRVTGLAITDHAGNRLDLAPDFTNPGQVLPPLSVDVVPVTPVQADIGFDVGHPAWVLAGTTNELDMAVFASGPGSTSSSEIRLSTTRAVAWGDLYDSFPTACGADGDDLVCPTGELRTLSNFVFRLPFTVTEPGPLAITATMTGDAPDAIQANNLRHIRIEVLDPGADFDCDGMDNAAEAVAGTDPLTADGGTGCAPWLADDVVVRLGTDHVDVTDGPATLPIELVLAPHRMEVVRVEVAIGGPTGIQYVDLTPGTPRVALPVDQRTPGGRWALQWADVHDDTGHQRRVVLGTPFTVTNPAPGDRDGPVFRGITVSPQTIDVSNGPVEVTVTIDADDLSGVREARLLVSNRAVNRQRDLRFDDPTAGHTFTVSAADAPGTWELRTALLHDGLGAHGYSVWSPGEFPVYTVVNDGPAGSPPPPQLHGVALTPPRLDVSNGVGRLAVSVDVTPGGVPLARALVDLCHRGGLGCRDLVVPFPAGVTDVVFDTWEAAGSWAVTSVHLEDQHGTWTFFNGTLNPAVIPDPDRAVNARFELVHARPDDMADLTLASASAPAWVLAGEPFKVRYTHWNRGPARATGVEVLLGASRTLAWGSPSADSGPAGAPVCDGGPSLQLCALNDTRVGGSDVYRFAATAAEAGPLVLDIDLTSDAPDPRPGDTAARVVVEVLDRAADHDGDGISNSDEAAAGSDPLVADAPEPDECDPLVCRSSILLKLVPLLERR